VASAARDRFLVWTEDGEVEAGISGRLRHSSGSWPAVGDWVALRENGLVIEQVLERRTVLSRKQPGRALEEQVLAANIDVLFVVCGLDHDYNERRIERYLVVARQSGARPVILLTKADLAESHGRDLPEIVARLHASAGVPVLGLNALSGLGVSELGGLVRPAETAALIGS
jgi:ribosome biogenesis GTPase